MITVENVSRKYDDFVAVDDVSFAIGHGEIVGLLGHNGAGKTTILKMLTGYLEPSAGRITIGDKNLADNRCLVQKQIGYLPENCPVYPEMTVADYLDYGATLHGVPKEQRSGLVVRAIERTALQDKAQQPIATLSRGYRQRTGVAQAILHDPRILVLDEPTNGLDPTQIQQMRQLIRELSQQSTVIISTHILQEVQAICDRVIIVNSGRIVVDSRLDSLQEDSRLLISFTAEEGEAKSSLLALDCVEKIERITEQDSIEEGIRFAVSLKNGNERQRVAATVAQLVHSKGWPLYSLGYESRDLESVFAQISAR